MSLNSFISHPDIFGAITVDEVADGHDEIGFNEIGVADGIGEDGDAIDRSAGAVAIDDEGEGVLLLGKGKFDLALAGGVEALGRGLHGGEFFTVMMVMVGVPDIRVHFRRVGAERGKAKGEGEKVRESHRR